MRLLGAVFEPELPAEAAQRRQAAYRALLDDLDGGEFEAACRFLANSARFFPKPVEVREAIAEVRRRREYAGRAGEYEERLALTEARDRAEEEVRHGVWDGEAGRWRRSGETAEQIYERWRRLAVQKLEQFREARRGETAERTEGGDDD